MSMEDNKAVLDRYVEEVWIRGNLAAVDDYIATDYVRHDPGLPAPIRGPEGVRQLVHVYRTAFPDINFTVEMTIAEADKVAVLLGVRGTHLGELMGIPATGRPVAITAMEIFRFVSGKVVEQWVAVDNLGMLRQLGVMPGAPT